MASTTATQNATQRKTPSKRKKPRRVVARIKKVPVVHTYYELEWAAKFKDDTLGETSYGPKRIRIAHNQIDVTNWSLTFWHEFFHAAFWELGYEPDCDSEAKVEGLAHALMAMLTNPNGRWLLNNMLTHLPEKR